MKMSKDLKRKSSEQNKEEPSNKKINTGEDNEEKISRLLSAVLAQGPLGNLVIILQDENENPYVTLQNSVAYLNMIVQVNRDDSNNENFSLVLNGEDFVTGTFPNGQLARRSLAEKALEKLKETCFFINKKGDYVNVTKENLQTSSSSNSTPKPAAVSTGSIAHKIMMKMGWSGGGLGAQGQGNLDSVMVYENVNREGLGNTNLMKEITKKLDNFSKSSDLLTLVFNADFTKEERALIHRVARKFNLKSKSTGSQSRKLTVSKKHTRIDIVRELLRIGGEDGLYKLHIPRKFAQIWE